MAVYHGNFIMVNTEGDESISKKMWREMTAKIFEGKQSMVEVIKVTKVMIIR